MTLKEKILSGEMRKKYGLDTGSGSEYARCRQAGGSDFEAQYAVYITTTDEGMEQLTQDQIDHDNETFARETGGYVISAEKIIENAQEDDREVVVCHDPSLAEKVTKDSIKKHNEIVVRMNRALSIGDEESAYDCEQELEDLMNPLTF